MPSNISIDFAPLPKPRSKAQVAPAAIVAFAFAGETAKPAAKKGGAKTRSAKSKSKSKTRNATPRLSASAAQADRLTGGAVTRAMGDSNFTGAHGATLTIRHAKGVVIIIGAGKKLHGGKKGEALGGHIATALASAKIKKTATLFVDEKKQSVLHAIGLGALLGGYHFSDYFTKGARAKMKAGAEHVRLTIASPAGKAAARGFRAQSALAEGVFLARDLAYEPANMLTPESFARRCLALKKYGIRVSVLDEKAMRREGMNLLLSVGQGSSRASRMVVMRYDGGRRGDKPFALIGKGVCFDSGGISIKPAGGMEDMKWDMGGAGAVTGAMRALAGRRIKRNVVGLIGLVENMPDGNATRPGDVVRSMSGLTVEIINTDAEGRLVLADVLTYALKHYKPVAMVNLATLTGAIMVALGKEQAGVFSNNNRLAKAIVKAGKKSGEAAWRMPLGAEYHALLRSHIADMKNIGGRWGGAVTAACFLERFAEKRPWAHIDIAGMAWADKARPTVPRGGTGYGVRLLVRLLEKGARSGRSS